MLLERAIYEALNFYASIKHMLFKNIPNQLQAEFHLEQSKKAKNTLKFFAFFVACPPYIIFWYQDLIIRGQYKWELLAIRLSTLIAGFLCYKAYSLDFFKKRYSLPQFFLVIYLALVLQILFIFFDFAGNNYHIYYACNIVFIVGASLFFLFNILMNIAIYLVICIPYWSYVLSHLSIIHIHSYINNLGATASAIYVGLLFRQFQIRNIENDFLNRSTISMNARFGESILHIIHDIRSPLQALKLVKSEGDNENSRQLLNLALNRVIGMCEDIMNSKRNLKINDEEVNLNQLIEELKNECLLFDKQIKIDFSAEYKNLESKKILADKSKILRVLNNLISNSIKALQTTYNPQIKVKVEADRSLKIFVEDNGPGIKNPNMIFTPGYSESGSTGLGLAFCKSIADHYNGKIEIQTKDKKTIACVTIFKFN